jgi:hypothetical protein
MTFPLLSVNSSTSALGAIEKPPPISRRGPLTPQLFGVSGWRSRVMGRGNERHTICAGRRVNAIMNFRLTPPHGRLSRYE